jgi:hypothetical protein
MAYVDPPKVTKSTTEKEIVDFLKDIRSRKEFNQYTYNDQSDVRTFMSQFLQLQGPQLFVRSFVNHNTPYKRLFINWQTGTGKTIAALSIAKEYASVYKNKKIFIVGFTRQLFINELLSHPEFGFITVDELKHLRQLRKNAEHQGVKSSAQKKYNDYLTQMKRRLTESGYHKFYGYKELSNRLFQPTAKAIINHFDFKSLFKTSVIRKDQFLEVLQQEIDNGNVVVDHDLLYSMKNSLLIADEIHNLYNIETENNYGVALQYILDTLGTEAPYTVLMSATPMTGSATEIIDLLNLLVRLEYLPNQKHLRKEDYFDLSQDVSTPKPGAIEELAKIAAGRTSFLLDLGKSSYPKRIFVGTKLDAIPYLHFTLCKMTEAQISVPLDETPGSSPHFMYDFAFPSENDGFISTPQQLRDLQNTSQQWKDTQGIQVIKDYTDIVISGTILHADSLAKYSGKYSTMLTMVLNIMKNDGGKILVYHPLVHSTGVLFIQEIFRMNGFIDEATNPTNDTICSICTVRKKDHDDAKGHVFIAARFMTIHSNVERTTLLNNIEKYNGNDNANGVKYRVLIGSRIIEEGYNFKAVRHQLVMALPSDIPSLLQVFGRVVRRGSHLGLPEDQRDVKITVLVSIHDNDEKSETFRYKKKMAEYLIIQELERALRKYSVDSFLSYDALKTAYPEIETKETLDALPYKPVLEGPSQKTTTVTYTAYGYATHQAEVITQMIWIIMASQPVWTYDMLFEALTGKHAKLIGNIPTFGYDPASFSKTEFDLALHYLSGKTHTFGGSRSYTIVACPPYYVLCPLNDSGVPVVVPEIYLRMSYVKKDIELKRTIDIPREALLLPRASLADIDAAFSTNAYPETTLLEFSSTVQQEYLKKLISDSFAGNTSALNSKAIDVYKRFQILITIEDLLKNKDIEKYIDITPYKEKEPQLPVGFIAKNSVILYSGTGTFNPVSLSTIMKAETPREENEIVVGFASDVGGKIEFMIRPPAKHYDDKRLQPRGAVCRTRLKPTLLQYIEDLQPHLEETNAWKRKRYRIGKNKTSELCMRLKLSLLTLEEDARRKGTNKIWLYLFNEL